MAAKTKKDDIIHPLGQKIVPIEKPSNLNRLIAALAVFCALLFVGDFVIHRHTYFETEAFHGFYALFGFSAFAFIVIATKYLKRLIGRSEDYYAPSVIDAEDYPDVDTDRKEYGDD